ncbi:LysR family transcriptional regulator [Nocardia sp. NPDC050630]|uniref:LysR family transcriptional regulator n=1 Tax=Nocardia sp. NPDC050630 TaxID=3364321 RepID=UPI00379C8989
MQFDQVEAFLAVAHQGGFTRASELLHVSQPAITRRIHLLERELGAPLFERVGRGVVLSVAGHTFLPHAEKLVVSVQDGVHAIRELQDETIGEVTLAFVGTLANTELAARLRDFRCSHPGVRLRVRTATSTGVSELVRRGDATLGLRYDLDTHPDLESRRIYDERLVPVCAADDELARRARISARELAERPWITFPPRPGEAREPYSSALTQILGADLLATTEVVSIDSLIAQARMVEAGFGLALLPESGIEPELRAGRLHLLDVDSTDFILPVHLVRRRNSISSGAIRSITELLENSEQTEIVKGHTASIPDRVISGRD